MPVLETRDLKKTFRGDFLVSRNEVLHGVDLAVEPGEIFGFLGHNGAGKTTTIKILTGLIQPSSGEALLFGRPSGDLAARARLGFLPEHPSFPDYLTGRELLDFYAKLGGMARAERRQRIPEVLDSVGMTAAADRRIRRYSKGMVQRIGIAQALLNDPELLLLDEPMEGLDPIGRREVRDLILGLRRRGKTVFFSSHILQDAEMICDRVAILTRGRIVRSGRLAELLAGERRPVELTCTGLAVEKIPPGTTLLGRQPGEVFLLVENEGDLPAVLDRVRSAGGSVLSAVRRRQSLEDLFLQETAGGAPPGGGEVVSS